ncbi:MAG TPA: translation initiation factor eIF-2B [Roseiflexaceae bacterium]|nr:translation initiation factor eIF-2B [Roseiflexaceae bacterium]
MDSHFSRLIATIATDNRLGAAQIAERAADLLLRRATTGAPPSPDAFRQELLETGWALIRAQPSMAPLVNLVNNVLWKAEESDTPDGLRGAVAQATEEFKRQIKQHALHVAEGALALVAEGSVVVTISYSTTVLHALRHAQRAGRRFTVICAESRPVYEGRQTAAQLASYGIPVKIMVDAAAVAAAASAQLVLVGADLLSMQGLVNKVGTRALAAVAHDAGVPFYALCGSEKFLPLGFAPLEQLEWPAAEVWPDAPEGVAVRNRYFDTTPLELVSGIVTEQGTLPVAAIEAWLAATRLHPALARPPASK